MTSTMLLLLLLCMIVSAVWSLQCTDPIGCFLQYYTITIDSITIPVDDTNSITINNFICNKFQLSSLSSLYKPPTTVGIDIDGLAVMCTGQYKYMKFDGSITASISNVDAIIDLLIGKDNNSIYPSSIAFSSCNVPNGFNTIKVDLKFTGTLNNLLNLVSGVVENYLKKSFDTIICTNLANFIAINGTSFIVNDIDPLLNQLISSEPSVVPIDVDSNNDYIHWTNSIISSMLHMIDSLLNSNVTLCMEEKYPEIKEILARPIIDYVIDVATNSTGIIDIVMTDNNTITILDGNYSLTVSSIAIKGFDSFTKVSLLEPSLSSNISLNTMIQFDTLEVTVYSSFQSTDSNWYLKDYKEQLEFKLLLSDITLILDVAVGVIKKDFSSLYVDQLFHLDCLLSSGLKYLNITSLIVDVGINNVEIVQVSGNAAVLEKDLVSLLNNVDLLINDGYPELITATIAGITQGPLRNLLNNVISTHRSAPICPQHVEPSTTDIIEWSESKLIAAAVIQADVINSVVDCITNETGRALLNFGHWNLSIFGLDSFYEFASLYPFSDSDKAYDIGSSVSVGQCLSDGTCKPLAISLNRENFTSKAHSSSLSSSLSTSLSALESSLSSLTMVSVKMSNLSLNTDTTVKFDMNAFKNLQLYQLDVTGCVASTVQVVKINSLSLGADEIVASFTKNGITKTKDITTQEGSQSVDTYTLTDLLNNCIESGLSSAAVTCANGGVPVISTDDDVTTSSSQTIITVTAAAGGIIVLAVLFLYYRKRVSRDKRISHDSNTSFITTWDFSESLINHKHTSFAMRMALLILIIGNIALFVISNSDTQAVAVLVEIDSTVNGKTITILQPTPVFYFDLIHTVRDMWNAKAYILASLIAFFTGFWPYFKLLFMLAAYTLPTSVISINLRDSRLKLLEILGKWSLVDFFVMTLFMIGFHFNIFVSNLAARVKVVPNMGFYTFVIATGLSLLLGHLLLAFHRKSINHPFLEAPGNVNGLGMTSENDYKERLVDTVYHFSIAQRQHESNQSYNRLMKITLTKRFKNFLGYSIVFSFICILGALFAVTIEFKILGLVGLLLGNDSDKVYSLLSLGQTLPSISPDDKGIRILQLAYFLLVVFMPFALLTSLTVLAFVPLPLWKQRYIYISMEIFNAWASFDVFLVSSTAALLQIVQLTNYMIGDSCDGINVYLKKYLDTSLNGDDVCIDLIFRFTSSAWVVFLAGISLFVLSTYCLKLFDKGLHERITLMKRINRHHVIVENNADSDSQLLLENDRSSSPSDKTTMVDISLESDKLECGINPIIADTTEKFKGTGIREAMKGDFTPIILPEETTDIYAISNISINELNDLRATLFRDSIDNNKKDTNSVSKFKVSILRILMKMKLIDVTDLNGRVVDVNSLGLERVSVSSIISSSSLETRETGETVSGVSPIIG